MSTVAIIRSEAGLSALLPDATPGRHGGYARAFCVARRLSSAGEPLASRLDPPDADALGLDLDEMTYSTVGALDDSSDKAVRDAGSISVTEIGRAHV